MKNINIIKLLVIGLLGFNSCSIDNVEPTNLLLEDNVITNESTAESVLNRIYNSGTRNSMYGQGIGGGGAEGFVFELSLAGSEAELLIQSNSLNTFSSNSVSNDYFLLESVYTDMYYNINLVNYFIEKIEQGDAGVSESRKNELLAEARFFRAMAHFNLLKVFGQFYDINSEFGVVISTEPIRGNVEKARSTVQETYNIIIDDLTFAANNTAPAREHYYISKTTVKALLGKVQLYMGDYTNAALNALDVINNSEGFILQSNYEDVFNSRWGASTLLASYVDLNVEGAQAHRFTRQNIGPSDVLKTIADEQDGVSGDGNEDYSAGYDPRFTFGFSLDEANTTVLIGKYPFSTTFTAGAGNSIKILRMAEVYLIYAEAEARRTGGDLTDALDKLNTIRNRASVAPKVLSDKATLLEDIRLEKLLELYCETGENWFDLVRYDRLGDISAASIKPSISSINKLTFPLPNNVLLGNPKLVPNP